MPLVTVKDKFQVTIPSRVRADLPVAVGDVLEATVEDGKIVLRPKAVIDRAELGRQIRAIFDATEPTPEDAAMSEDELMDAAITEVAAARAARRTRKR